MVLSTCEEQNEQISGEQGNQQGKLEVKLDISVILPPISVILTH